MNCHLPTASRRPCPTDFYLLTPVLLSSYIPEHPIGAHTCADHTVPYGTVLLGWRFSRHFVPGYDRLSLRDALADISQRHLARACCQMSRRDGAIVAWHEVPGKAPPQKDRPVGYGAIRASMRRRFDDSSDEISTRNTSGNSCGPIIPYPTGRFFRGNFPRHFVPGYDRCCPFGTQAPCGPDPGDKSPGY